MDLVQPFEEPRRLTHASAACALFAPIADEAVEVVAIAYLAADRRLLGMRHARSASVDTLNLPIRDIAADALAFGASGVVIAHNHPSGDPTPSTADREATRMLAHALDPLGVRVIDHLVMTRTGFTSFRAMGLL